VKGLNLISKKQEGITFIEIIVVIGVFSILVSFSTFSLLNIGQRSTSNTAFNTLISDIKHQQARATSGEKGEDGGRFGGVFFAQNSYVLFSRSSYSPSDPSNFTVVLDDDLEFQDILFSSSQVVFDTSSGEFLEYKSGEDSVVLKNKTTNDQKKIKINRFGVIDEVN